MKRIATPDLASLGLEPKLGENMETLLAWLEEWKLVTSPGTVYDRDDLAAVLAPVNVQAPVLVAQSTGRQAATPMRMDARKALLEKFRETQINVDAEKLWTASRAINRGGRVLNWERIPADFMAFYRPFHMPPFDQWGIYLLIGPLLEYHRRLSALAGGRGVFSAETLMHLVLFEVFNHEFFHHVVESTATTIEVLLAALDQPQPIYLKYLKTLRGTSFDHPHAPLEEALANAYAYNALSFISRMKTGFRTTTVKIYQRAIAAHWSAEPAGYRNAGFYTGENYVSGGAVLLSQLLGMDGAQDAVPLSVLARRVMPSGFTAFVAKPDIPTWLVGSATQLSAFEALVPAPNEAYTQLFWPYNTSHIDKYIEDQVKKEQEARAAAKARVATKP